MPNHTKINELEHPLPIFPQNCRMQQMMLRWLLCCGIALCGYSAAAQPSSTDWFLKDPESDQVQGTSTDKVYETLLKDRESRQVIVAVIDGGVDITHEDLKDLIWTNKGEVAGNGVDDDNNGYVDDVHGWNFIGGKNGSVAEDSYEMTREYVRLKEKYTDSNVKLNKKEKAEYEKFLKLEDKYRKLKEKNEKSFDYYKLLYLNLRRSIDTLKAVLNTDTLTVEKLQAYEPDAMTLIFAKGYILNLVKQTGDELTPAQLDEELSEAYNHYRVIVEFGYNEAYDSRQIVGDNYNDPYEKGYGNNDVVGPDARHGTHVAGLIAANRKNDLGIKGIADNVLIMPVRAVPNGDERDKDVANAIIYATDNGAQIINMSFGKSYSPEKEVVDKAVKYAEKKGVLLIHAAGNDGQDLDKEREFPNRYYADGKEAKNWIEVGASSFGADEDFIGDFSNYGKNSVDVFAPGLYMYSTVANNKYEELQGTSMAAPVVSGVAAMLMSYFPDLTAAQVKDIIRQSSRRFDGLKVQQPKTRKEVPMSDLSITGGLINAFEAVKLAQSLNDVKVIK
jgi:subtilisin family serine protease